MDAPSLQSIDPVAATQIVALLAAALVTYLPRGLGVLAGRRIDPGSRLFRWFACVAYAMLAGLVARMIVLPIGALQGTSLVLRLGAVAVAIAVFLLCRRSVPLGVAAGLLTLVAGITLG
jgi:branched-subunit amino acid transport protein